MSTTTTIDDLIDQANATITALQEAIRDARDLERFEAGDSFTRSVDADELSILREAVAARAAADQAVTDAVADARSKGLPWASIGAALGTTGQAANQRYGKLG